ncbi:MAG: guanylate kinase [Oscillospiraceae bacterium]|nr:guanylate kinase [Oscillospiraceae bacterium]
MKVGFVMQKGSLFVVSAPAGCGKDTILNELLKKTDKAGYAVSATTRAPREGEVNGVHYHFLTREEFERRIAEKEVLEYTEYCGNYYGTLRKSVNDLLNEGKDAILKIEVEGAMNIKKLFPEACLVFILPPSWEVLEKRLRDRGTETEDKIVERTKQAHNEVKFAKNYDYLIVNDELENAVSDLLAVMRAEKLRRARNDELLAQFN